MIVPLLGMRRRRSLVDALFTNTQQRVLGLLFGQPGTWFGTSELIRRSRAGSGATQRQLAVLKEAGIVRSMRVQNQVHYRANPESPIFDELVAIIAKTVGLAEPLGEALAPLTSRIDAAFVFGSIANRRDHAQSDIDVMVLSDRVTYGDVFSAVEPLHERLGRRVNPTIYTVEEFIKRRRDGNPFIARVLEQPKIWILGNEDVLRG